jgi:hypothetical protein
VEDILNGLRVGYHKVISLSPFFSSNKEGNKRKTKNNKEGETQSHTHPKASRAAPGTTILTHPLELAVSDFILVTKIHLAAWYRSE